MVWRETCAVDERMKFVLAVDAREQPMAAVCRRYRISRRVGYKWLKRDREAGLEGLADRARAPLNHPHAVSTETAEACLAVRRAHPRWGPVKVRAWLMRADPGPHWPAASTIGALFEREGLTVKRRKRHRAAPRTQPFSACAAPNDVWCIDFKGWFLTGDGMRCEPLTLCDAYSRYLLRCQAVTRCDGAQVWPILDAAFREYGLPRALRSDNGPPFASTGAGGLSRFAVRVIKAGVLPERITPGKPQENGRLERMHLTIDDETASPPAPTRREQLERLQEFRRDYNEERPHQALGNTTPAEHYCPSPRAWDGVLREPDYEAVYEIRRVRKNGEINWRGTTIYINQALSREPVGLLEGADGDWSVHYGPIELGLIDLAKRRLQRPKALGRGLVDNPDGLPTTPPPQQPHQPL